MADPTVPQPRRLRPVGVVAALAVVLFAVAAAGYGVGRYFWADYQLAEARRDLAKRDFPRARAHLALCLEVWRDSGEAHFLAARAARRAGDVAEAGRQLDVSRRLGWVAEAVQTEELLAAAQQGDLAGSEEPLWADLERGHPDAVLILEALLQGYLRKYRLPQALRAADLLLERQPDHAQALLWRAEALTRMLRAGDALADLRKAVDLEPANETARLRLGEALAEATRFGEAQPHFEWLQQRQPSSPPVLLGLARCRHAAGRSDDARRLLAAVMTQEPGDGAALLLRGQVELEDGRPADAEGWLRRAVAAVPHERQAHYLLGQCLERREQAEEAAREFAEVKRIDDDLHEIADVGRQMLSAPHDPALRYRAGTLFLRNHNDQEALRWFASALEEDPKHAETHRALEEYFRQHGQAELAETHRRAAGP
jgi:tetratricopeptide (TPR) repeat protein